jgi:23S rRNA (cytosine1962-C5)-methyltransferase
VAAEGSRRPRVFLTAGGDRRIAAGHPWAYSNEIRMDAAAKALPAGTIATLHRVDGKSLGVGSFNPHTLIAFRLFDRDADIEIDEHFLARRLNRALRLRQQLFDRPYYRLIHAEGDGIPGLVVDRYGPVFVLQVNTAGIEGLTPALVRALARAASPEAIVLRNDAPARAVEGLPAAVTVVSGEIGGAVPVEEGGLGFFADVIHGQKTGWYFDQRLNRAAVAPLAAAATMLDAYSHTGGFAVAAAAAGATRVVAVDSSEPALALARQAAAGNGIADRLTCVRGDVFAELERLAADGERFRVVVADPPAFVKSKKELASGLRGYRKLARLAARLVEPEGFLFIASCSHNVDAAAFTGEVAQGLARAGRIGRILRQTGAGPDHPVHPHLPETAYLKSLLIALD